MERRTFTGLVVAGILGLTLGVPARSEGFVVMNSGGDSLEEELRNHQRLPIRSLTR
jgi:hypothetical protein